MSRTVYFLCFLSSLIWTESKAAPKSSPGEEIRIMWYNVENLFHPSDDSIKGDDDFTPDGIRRWTYERYWRKLTHLSKVIVAAGRWDPPGLIGLCEVESAEVLEDLISHPILEPYDYLYLHRDSPDHRGMDVACLYRKKLVCIRDWELYRPVPSDIHGRTREVMHVAVNRGTEDTLDVFLVHFKSRYGGTGATAGYRRAQVLSLLQRVDSVRHRRENDFMVLAGDFNEEPGAYSMEPLDNPAKGALSFRNITAFGQPGSYKYRERWSSIDRFMVGGSDADTSLRSYILELDPLLKPDEAHGGVKPARSYEGYSYAGGISDHLPVLLEISFTPSSIRSERWVREQSPPLP